MDMFQDSMPFVMENLLDTVAYLKGEGLVYVQKQKKMSYFGPCILNNEVTFSTKSIICIKLKV
jgi:hypothetical protein